MSTCARNMWRHEIKLIVKQILCIKLVKYCDKLQNSFNIKVFAIVSAYLLLACQTQQTVSGRSKPCGTQLLYSTRWKYTILVQHDKQTPSIHAPFMIHTDKSETRILDRSATLFSWLEDLFRQVLWNFSNSSEHIRLKPSTVINTILNRIYDRNTFWLGNLKRMNYLGTHTHWMTIVELIL